MKRSLFRQLLFIGIALAVLTLFVACGGRSASTADETVTVRIWFGRNDFVPGDDFAAFHAANPNIRVEYDVIPLEQAHSDYLRNFAAGNAPDVFQIFHQFTPTLVAQNGLLDLTPYINEWRQNEPADFNDVIPVAFNIPAWDGGIYGIGMYVAPYFQAYRSDWLAQAGMSEPKTWDEVLAVSRAVRDNVLDASASQFAYAHPGGSHHPPFWWMSIYMSMGGQFSNTGLPQIDSEAGIALIDFMQTLARERLMDPEAVAWASGDMRGAFMGGRAMFFPEAINIFATAQNELDYNSEWEVQLQPYRAGAEADYRVNSFGWPFMVSAATKNPEAVMKVLRYMFDPEISAEVALRYQPVTRVSVLTSPEYLAAHPYFPILEEGFLNMDIIPGHVRNPEVSATINQLKNAAFTSPNRPAAEIAREFQTLLNALDS